MRFTEEEIQEAAKRIVRLGISNLLLEDGYRDEALVMLIHSHEPFTDEDEQEIADAIERAVSAMDGEWVSAWGHWAYRPVTTTDG